MSWVVKIGWIAGVGAVTALIFWTGAGSVLHAFATAGWGVFGVVLLRGTAVAGAGLGWFVLFPTVAIVTAVAIPALCGFYLAQRPIGQRVIKTIVARAVGEREWLAFGAIDALFARLGSIYANRPGVVAAAAIHMAVWLFGALEVW